MKSHRRHPSPPADAVRQAIDALYRAEGRRIFATLVRLLGDFDLAEEALHDGFRVALERWTADGIPEHPRAWIVSAGRFKAIDALRRQARFSAWDEAGDAVESAPAPSASPDWDARDAENELLE